MSYISMAGAGSVGETADFLRQRMMQCCELVEEKRRSAGGAEMVFMLFESSGLFTKNVELLALNVFGDGKAVTVDAFGHASGSIWADDEALPLSAARALRERGFEENEREGWKISGSAADVSENAASEIEYVSPLELARLGQRQVSAGDGADRPEPAEAEKLRRRGKKRSYDPEI